MNKGKLLDKLEHLSQCHLSVWETGFLWSCCSSIAAGKELAEKQLQWVEAIYKRKVAKGLIHGTAA